MNNILSLTAIALAAISFTAAPASAETPAAPADEMHLGAYAELDVGLMAVLREGAAFGGGVTYGPFRAGISYATFKSNKSFGGVPDGFEMRVNYIYGLNAAYFIGQRSDRGFYLQGMLHLKQQGVTNTENGAHENLGSVAVGAELGYLWKIYKGFYVEPRVGALYYVDKPQPGNDPVNVGGRMYDNDRHKNWDTYFIPTISVGYSW